MAFVDKVDVVFEAGAGGDGKVSFRHEKFRAMGGPDGGDGGDGGDVILVASRNQNTLATFRYKKQIKAPSGQPGLDSKKHGRSATDLEVAVPVGTVVMAGDEILADLASDGQKEVIAKGGKGGFGNAHFTSSTRQAPRVAEKGEAGEVIQATLELKMIADVGIVGLPNAGKSTLLSVISNARPEIADYPFTTLQPNLGVVDIDGKHSLLFADIPGLIEGASQGKGLGDEFLRHVERTKVLIHLIDAYNEDLVKAYKTIVGELQDYQVDLSKRPQIVAITKTEGLTDKDMKSKLSKLQKSVPKAAKLMAISSQSGLGINELKREILKIATKSQKQQAKDDKLPIIGLKDEDDDDWRIEKTKVGFVVIGSRIENFAKRTKFGDYYGEQRLRDIMAKTGIMKELERLKILPGQKIIIGQPPLGELKY
jgi:GTP-binding protein